MKASKTKQRILDVSLMLFNLRGERLVTTNHIAEALQMSPGNLYYHYRNKQQIIDALFQQYQQSIFNVLAIPENRQVTGEDKIQYFRQLNHQLWHYRFLHRDVQYLLDYNEQFKEKYQHFLIEVMLQARRIYEAFVVAGLMRISSEEIEALIINIWLILTNWMNFLQGIGLNKQEQLSERWMWYGLRQILFLEAPYLTQESHLNDQQLMAGTKNFNFFVKLAELKSINNEKIRTI